MKIIMHEILLAHHSINNENGQDGRGTLQWPHENIPQPYDLEKQNRINWKDNAWLAKQFQI